MAVAVPIISTFDNKGVRQAEGSLGGLSKSAKAAGAAIAASFVAVTAALGKMVMAAAEDEKSFNLLAQTLSKVTGASAQMSAQVDKQIGKMAMATGIADDKLRPALSNLVRATGSLSLSQKALSQVMDLSVAKQIDMDAASNAVAKALAGNTTALVKMLPGLKGVIDNGSSAAEVLAAIDSQVGGAAAANAQTFSGRIERLKIVLGEMAETVGSWLLPMLSKLAEIVNTYLVQYFTYLSEVVGPKVNEIFGKLGAVIGEHLVPLVNDYLIPAFRYLADLYYNYIIPAIQTVAEMFIEKLGKAFATIRERIEENRESFAKLRDFMDKVVAFITRYFIPAYNKLMGAALERGISALGLTIDGFAKFIDFAGPFLSAIGRAVGGAVKGITSVVNAGIDGLNTFIGFYNRLPSTFKPFGDISLIPRIELPDLDFNLYKPGGFGTIGEFRGAMGTPVPGAGGIDVGAAVPPSSGGKAGAAAGPANPLAGMTAEEIAAGRANADFFAMGLDNPIVRRGAPVTVNVNGGLATSAEIGQAVVDAIKQYTNVSGPVDIAVR